MVISASKPSIQLIKVISEWAPGPVDRMNCFSPSIGVGRSIMARIQNFCDKQKHKSLRGARFTMPILIP